MVTFTKDKLKMVKYMGLEKKFNKEPNIQVIGIMKRSMDMGFIQPQEGHTKNIGTMVLKIFINLIFFLNGEMQ